MPNDDCFFADKLAHSCPRLVKCRRCTLDIVWRQTRESRVDVSTEGGAQKVSIHVSAQSAVYSQYRMIRFDEHVEHIHTLLIDDGNARKCQPGDRILGKGVS